MDLKDLDNLEDGLYLLDEKSRQLQEARIAVAKNKMLEEMAKARDLSKIRTIVKAYDESYKIGKQTKAFLLITSKEKERE